MRRVGAKRDATKAFKITGKMTMRNGSAEVVAVSHVSEVSGTRSGAERSISSILQPFPCDVIITPIERARS